MKIYVSELTEDFDGIKSPKDQFPLIVNSLHKMNRAPGITFHASSKICSVYNDIERCCLHN